MPAVSITPDDLKPYRPDIPPDQAQAMIDDAMAYAAFIAPCILDPRFEYEAAGPFAVQIDTTVRRNGFFTDKEEDQLKAMCSNGASSGGGAWNYDTLPPAGQQHAEICCKTFNEPHCSCGANLTRTGLPLWDGYAS
jgi:hypothetical protein